IAVKRSKSLPDGSIPDAAILQRLAGDLTRAICFARTVGRLQRDDDARDLWHQEYERLTSPPAGLLGAATSRAAPHVVRLSCMYALLDSSPIVTLRHLQGALALWRYVEASTRFILGNSLGDPIADAILLALRGNPEGLARTAIHKLSAGHWSTKEITSALQRLSGDGLAFWEKTRGKGRPAERWYPANYEKKAKEEPNEGIPSLSSHNSFFSEKGSPSDGPAPRPAETVAAKKAKYANKGATL
ncbi:MAG TPA: hypothetical protein VJO33_04725, partial [Gemmatimonadaceae bacterium]|nr:hypothetical protein [Gemmatimonadaceae bacterium]